MAEQELEEPWQLEPAEAASDLEQFYDDVEQAPEGSNEVGLQPSATWQGKVRAFHPGFFGFERAYNRYFYTLLVAMRYFESIRDDERLGRVLLALLHGEVRRFIWGCFSFACFLLTERHVPVLCRDLGC